MTVRVSSSTRLRRIARTAVVMLSLAGLAGCAEPFDARVSRFQHMPPPEGQSFAIVPDNPRLAGSLEFDHYADLVRDQLARRGYRPVADPASANLVVSMHYGVDRGHERLVTDYDPIGPVGWGPYGYGRFGGPFAYGPYYGRHGYIWGWNDPFLWGGYGYAGVPDVHSYTVYQSELDLTIERVTDHAHVFEGRAQAHSTTNALTYLVPNLVEAMFTGFPGNSGETVRISVAPEKSAHR